MNCNNCCDHEKKGSWKMLCRSQKKSWSWHIIIPSPSEMAYNKPPNLRCMNYVYGNDLMGAKQKRRSWLRYATWCITQRHVSWYRRLRSGPCANWCRAKRLWAKWENYTFSEESAAVVGEPFLQYGCSLHLCGGGSRLTVFAWDGVAD